MKFIKRCLIFFVLMLVMIFIKYNLYNKSETNFSNSLAQDEMITEANTKMKPFNPGVFILTKNLKEYSGICSAFTSVGYDVINGGFNDYEKRVSYNGVFIFPENTSKFLSTEEINIIKENVKKGQNIIVIGKTQLARELGVYVRYKKRVSSYNMEDNKNQLIEIKGGMESYKFDTPQHFKTVAKNSGDNTDIMIQGKIGQGKVIYSGSNLAPSEGSGYEYYPLFLNVFKETFNLTPVFSRNNGGAYVDIGYHLDIDTPKQIAERSKKWGYNQINIGMWSSLTNKNIKYYKDIIEESHKRGIKVFAWFELPMVSIDFWNQHPEWRQKTVDGRDAKIDWRYLMALENDKCFDAVKEEVKKRMNMFDFDGIDIAEIYYESPGKGFTNLKSFTPMNDSFRENFKELYRFDPKDVFNSSSKYYWKNNKNAKDKLVEERVRLVTKQNEEMLELSKEIKEKKTHLEVSLTVIDSKADKRMRENIGLDSNEIIKLENEHDFILNIEDPFTLWSLGSKRYSIIGKEYKEVIHKNKKLYIDINIVDRYGENYPTKKQRGIELYSLIHNASKYTDKVMMYSLATPEKEDMDLVPYVYAYDVKGYEISNSTYKFKSKSNFIWHINMRDKEVYIDDKKYPIYTNDYIVIPYGKRKVEIKNNICKDIRITDVNSNIEDSYYKNNGIKVKYNSNGRCFITVDRKPKSIVLDGKRIKPDIKEIGKEYSIILPSGKHDLDINIR